MRPDLFFFSAGVVLTALGEIYKDSFFWHIVLYVGIGLMVVSAVDAVFRKLIDAERKRMFALGGMIVFGMTFLGCLAWYLFQPGTPPKVPPPQAQVIWDDHLGHSYSGFGAAMITSAFQINAVNNLGHELRIEKAFVVSGEGHGEKMLLVSTTTGWMPAEKVNPIANGQRLTFKVDFGSTSSREVFENWKTFQITLIYEGGISRKNVTEKMVRSVFAGFSPSPIGPQVIPKGRPPPHS